MSRGDDMASDETEQNPFSRPGFVVAALVVVLLIVAGVIVGVVVARDNDTNDSLETAPAPTTTVETPEPSPAKAGGASICGLKGDELTGDLSKAPKAVWEFQGTTGYPTSSKYGPGETDADGVRYCFQQSPSGALFAAANAVAQGSDPAVQEAFATYFTAAGPGRDAAIANAVSGSASSGRIEIAGFRLLEYGDGSARVDVAVRATSNGQTIYGSGVYPLTWEDGDWKLVVSDSGEMQYDFAQIPDLAGYISWGA